MPRGTPDTSIMSVNTHESTSHSNETGQDSPESKLMSAIDAGAQITDLKSGASVTEQTMTAVDSKVVHDDVVGASQDRAGTTIQAGDLPDIQTEPSTDMLQKDDALPPPPPIPSAPFFDDVCKDLESTLTTDIQYPSLSKPLEIRKADSKLRNRQALTYLVLVEDRIKALEDKISILQMNKDAKPDDPTQKFDAMPKIPLNPKLPGLELGVGWYNFEDFARTLDSHHAPEDTPHVVEVLTEPWGTLSAQNRLLGNGFPLNDAYPLSKAKQSKGGSHTYPESAREDAHGGSIIKPTIERIRICSTTISDAFAKIMGKNDAPKEFDSQIRPFKFLLAYEDEIRQHVKDLEERVRQKPALSVLSGPDPEADPVNEATKQTNPQQDGEQSAADDGVVKQSGVQSSDTPPEPGTDDGTEIRSDEEALSHFQVLINFMDNHLQDEFNSYKKLRSRNGTTNTPKVSFPELWQLFAPGDIIYEPVNEQALRVVAVGGGRRQLRKKTQRGTYANANPFTNPYPAPPRDIYSDPLPPLDEDPLGLNESAPKSLPAFSAMPDDLLLPFVLTCVYIDFNGDAVGPVMRQISISGFDESRSITNLPAYPIEYADMFREGGTSDTRSGFEPRRSTQAGVRETLELRGKKFADFANKTKVAHREYRGLSLGRVREQVDSEIVVDPGYFYETEASATQLKPDLGWKDVYDGDQRETQESIKLVCFCGRDGCLLDREVNTYVYDDRKVDIERRSKLLEESPELYRWKAFQTVLKDQHKILFPRCVFAYVLKNREWSKSQVILRS